MRIIALTIMLALAVISMPGSAHAIVFPLESSGGILNPCVDVAFNPQPDPPADPITILDLLTPSQPTLHNSLTGPSTFNFVFSFVPAGQLPAVQFQGLGAPDSNGRTSGQIVDGRTGEDLFLIALLFTGDGSVVPGSWDVRSFDDAGIQGFSATLRFTGDPDASFQVFEQGNLLSFALIAPVPEPSSIGVLLVGLVVMTVILRSRASLKPLRRFNFRT